MGDSKKPTYTLHYFNLRSRGEGARLLFHFAQVPFEDHRVERADWFNKDSSKVPHEHFLFGQMPVLEINDENGHWFLSQSTVICRFLAQRFKLTGKNEKEAAMCEEVISGLHEAFDRALPQYYMDDEDFRKKTFDRLEANEYPRCLGALEKRLKENGGKFMVGDQYTWADVAVAWIMRGCQSYAKPAAKLLDKYPGLLELTERIEKVPSVAEYLKTRPESDV